ncbi:hypothetical protein IV203_003066 [Nitzschia inconspicua]|uniref:Uncharacterized protein n=1 Tax=Nitzschia inconspicua TaxID=303405 RepID=A0A9K3PNY2_9STRA|nr:hypothetical protein IV203_003066 [Nitzschia inconspicua]
MPPDPFTGIPADIQAFRDGWTEITDHGHPYEVVLARDFSDDYLAQRICCGTFQNMGAKVTSSLVSLGKEGVSLHQVVSVPLLSNDKSFSHSMPPLSRSLDIIIMDPHRFATIQSCTRGFSQAGRTGSEDSDVWMEAGAMLRQLNELEVAIFSRSASNLLNHGNGSIVVDDELIASRASWSKRLFLIGRREKRARWLIALHVPYQVSCLGSNCVGEGSIVQIVVIKISTEQRDEYAENLCKVVNPLLGFLHSEDVMARGILIDSDFPDWVTDPQRTILKTRANLYDGHLKLISTEEGDVRPTKPVSIYKHSTQYRYNKHKPGLDKNTEISDRVAFHTSGPLEAKYVFRMLDAVMVNAWRAYQAVTVISPWLRALGSPPSLAQVRTKLHNFVGVEDFVADVALECLRCLAAQKAIPLFPADVPQEEREERQFKSEFSEYKRMHGWPIRKFALKKFASNPFLQKLRLCTFVDHRPQRIRDVQPVICENGTSQKVVRRKCVLCFVPGKMIPGTSTIKSKEIAKNSTYMCPTCMVVLCKKTVRNSGAKSCHTLWHERHNLEAEGSKCRKRLRVAREMNDDEAQKRNLHATNASIKRHSPAKTSQQIQRSQTQVAINDPQDPQDSFDTIENVVEHVLENLMEMEHGEEHGEEEKEEDQHDFLDMEEYSDGSDE